MKYLKTFILIILIWSRVSGQSGSQLDLSNYCTRIILSDSVEISLYTPSMFRFRISKLKGEKFPLKYTIPFVIGRLNNWERVPCKKWNDSEYIYVKTERILIKISNKNTLWSVWTPDGKRRIYPSDGPIYGMFRDGYTLFDNASAFNERNNNSRFSHWFYNPATKRYVDTFLGNDLIKDKYFVYGPDYETLFVQLNELVGPEPLLPKKAYGFFQTQHLGCKGSQKKLLALAQKLREEHIPCDNLIVDFEWGDGCPGEEEKYWGQLDWSPNYTKPLSPREMITMLHAMHFNVMLIHHSAPDFPHREEYTPRRIHQWTAKVYEENRWWQKLKEQLDAGVDGTWQDTRQNDITDGVIWTGLQKYFGPGRRVLFMGCRKMMVKNPWEKRDNTIPANNIIGSRRYPFRWTGDASPTYSELKWHIRALTDQHGSMKGVSYITADCFGKDWKCQARWNQFVSFLPVARSHTMKPWAVKIDFDELARIMDWRSKQVEEFKKDKDKLRKYLEKLPDENKRNLPTAENSIRKHLQLRYRLLPYLYSYAFVDYLTGMPICRPMLLAFPADKNCNKDQWPYQYMFGENILVAPVYGEFDSMEIYLPGGFQWIDYWDKTVYQGGQVINYNTSDVEKPPLFIKSGSIIPMRKSSDWIEPSLPDNPLIVEIYPSGISSFKLYEDDGVSTYYQKGMYTVTSFQCTKDTNGDLEVHISKMEGNYKGKPSRRNYIFKIYLVQKTPTVVEWNRIAINRVDNTSLLNSKERALWYYNEEKNTVRVNVFLDTDKEGTVTIKMK